MKTKALELAAQGYRVFPCHTVHGAACSCEDTYCTSPGKHPRTKHGVHDATKNPEKIEQWWGVWKDANIGIATGVNGGVVGLHVVDVDDPLVWERLVYTENHGVEPSTLTAQTGSGGKHFYFSTIERLRNTKAKVSVGIDTRGEGGYVLAPPSNHVQGSYSWLTPTWMPVAPLPSWLAKLIEPPTTTREAPPTWTFQGTSRYGEAIVNSAVQRLRSAAEGERNTVLAREAFRLGQWIGGGEIDSAGIFDMLVEQCPDPDRKKTETTAARQLLEGSHYPRRKER